jgi:hypothetical protein
MSDTTAMRITPRHSGISGAGSGTATPTTLDRRLWRYCKSKGTTLTNTIPSTTFSKFLRMNG